MEKILFKVLSELFINLSAGWFGAILIVPNFSHKKGKEKILALTANFLFGIISLGLAIILQLL